MAGALEITTDNNAQQANLSGKLHFPELGPLFDNICDNFFTSWPDLDPVLDDLPILTAIFCSKLKPGDLQTAVEIEIYTDGSYARRR